MGDAGVNKFSVLKIFQKFFEDYSKDVGYLVLYNFDKMRYDFKFNESSNIFPPKLIFNNKVYYFIVIDMYDNETVSKLGEIKRIEITGESAPKQAPHPHTKPTQQTQYNFTNVFENY